MAVKFPQNGITWDFNYRAKLDFMHQAILQREAQELRVKNGWVYFLHGWTHVVFQVLHIKLTEGFFERLAKTVQVVRY